MSLTVQSAVSFIALARKHAIGAKRVGNRAERSGSDKEISLASFISPLISFEVSLASTMIKSVKTRHTGPRHVITPFFLKIKAAEAI